jgi:methyltransferase (TIGR00027 family)
VVLLAAGYDIRAFRLSWPVGTSVLQVDQSVVLKEKKRILYSTGALPTCTQHIIEADLNHPWKEPLIKAVFGPAQSSVWLLEGFFFYLPNESNTQII